MTADPGLSALLADWGLVVLAPLAVIEGPVVTVVAGALVQAGTLNALATLAVLVAADLLGDVGLYLIGRHARALRRSRWLDRLGLTRRRLAHLVRGFRRNDLRLMLLGKWTHAAGFAVLLAAGVARVPPGRFVAITLGAAVPKTVVLMAIGWGMWDLWDRLDGWALRLPLIAVVLGVLTLPLWLRRTGRRP